MHSEKDLEAHREHVRAHFSAMDTSQLRYALDVRNIACNGEMDDAITALTMALTNHEVLYRNLMHVLCLEAGKSDKTGATESEPATSLTEVLLQSSDGKSKSVHHNAVHESVTFIDGVFLLLCAFVAVQLT